MTGETLHDKLHRLMAEMNASETVTEFDVRLDKLNFALRQAFREGRLVAVDAPKERTDE
jgi:hypothetical protein